MDARVLKMRCWVLLLLLAWTSGLATESVSDTAVRVHPLFTRVELPAGGSLTVPVTVSLPAAAQLLSVSTDCRCVSLVEPTPRAVTRGANLLHLRVLGLLPGVKSVRFVTSSGTMMMQVQVSVPGTDSTRHLIDGLAKRCRAEGLLPLVIVHDLGGRLANCGCSTGSLGGVDHLAALPAAFRAAGFAHARYALTGTIDGDHAGLGAALADSGWEVAPPDILVAPAASLDEALVRPEVVAVIPMGHSDPMPAHAKIVPPVLDGGAIAVVVLRDAATGRNVDQVILPIDGSLPSDPTIRSRFVEPATVRVRAPTDAEHTACSSCHASAHQAWSISAHARAFSSLRADQQVDACTSCHSSPPAPGSAARIEHVSCIGCHRGAAAHAQAAGSVKTLGAVDCRTCHDATHHPAFDPVAAWLRIQHGLRP